MKKSRYLEIKILRNQECKKLINYETIRKSRTKENVLSRDGEFYKSMYQAINKSRIFTQTI